MDVLRFFLFKLVQSIISFFFLLLFSGNFGVRNGTSAHQGVYGTTQGAKAKCFHVRVGRVSTNQSCTMAETSTKYSGHLTTLQNCMDPKVSQFCWELVKNTLCCKCLRSLACLYCKMPMFQREIQKHYCFKIITHRYNEKSDPYNENPYYPSSMIKCFHVRAGRVSTNQSCTMAETSTKYSGHLTTLKNRVDPKNSQFCWEYLFNRYGLVYQTPFKIF